ncbi:DUF2975 domain-containing protein [Lederbergia wuyishanensis]|uniref:DUF2975 domain-containing protein n=1 Tax=Lederbergia wuyishanensis TaxID=1347903 RepID=A0ABU0D870_9BACI|nr:DUF2975 domain-containing protein [Lederbergia wuyishanensis]MCJ8009301.1 DUF2975 domain-containing protein [Lederbergia wuyishanensis]MDQ0344565.1 hypothetical protein [Lederbergia wuyishanensis]
MKRGSTTFLKLAVLFIGVIILVLCIFWLPWEARHAAEMNPEYAYLRYPVLFGLYITAIPFFLALYQSLKLLIYVEKNNAFSKLAVTSLKYIMRCANTITILYVVGFFFLVSQNAMHPGIALVGFTIIFTSLIISLFSAVLQALLKNALDIKSENDLTI